MSSRERERTEEERGDEPGGRSSTSAVRGPQTAGGAIDRAHLSEDMARSLAAEGRRDEAVALYRLLCAERPTDGELRQRLEDLLQSAEERARRERPRISPSATGPYSEPFGMLDLTEPPETYDVDEVEVLYKDPWWAFVYWEVTDAGLRAARAQLGSAAETARLTLRVFSSPPPVPGQPQARDLRDHPLTQESGRRYIEVPRPGGVLRVAVGLLTREGFFASIAHSSVLQLPPPSVSAQVSQEWLEVTPMATRGRVRERIQAQGRDGDHRERSLSLRLAVPGIAAAGLGEDAGEGADDEAIALELEPAVDPLGSPTGPRWSRGGAGASGGKALGQGSGAGRSKR